MLAAVDVADRVELVLAWARDHLAELQVAETIRNDVTEGVDKQQREFLLRQQLAAIRKELGEGDDDVVGEYRTKLETLDAADSARNFIAKEIDRLERTSAQSPEHGLDPHVARPRLRAAVGRPQRRQPSTSPRRSAILDDDHYGLADVKSRIVEFLAVQKLRDDRERRRGRRARPPPGAAPASIITLVGPPGVGKTSASASRSPGRWAASSSASPSAASATRPRSAATAARTSARSPGRIVKAITEAGTMNPVVLLDEVDKLGAGAWSGDPTAALLEVLDPAQNHTFRDHYLELDLDLSEVVFIATANVLDTVPAPLLDRMDVVRLDGYTDDEKVFIAHRYLLPRQLPAGRARRRRAGRRRRRRSSASSAATPARPASARSSASSAACRARRRPRSPPASRCRRSTPTTWPTGSAGRRSSTTSPSAPSCPAWPPAWPSPATAATCCSSRRRRSRRRPTASRA